MAEIKLDGLAQPFFQPFGGDERSETLSLARKSLSLVKNFISLTEKFFSLKKSD